MRQVIVHAGFHKTGTTTVQKTLRKNRALLAGDLNVILRPDMVAVCEAARSYSVSRDALDLAVFQYELAQLAEGWKHKDGRPVLMVSEDLCGHMPGRRGITQYTAAPRLMQTFVATLAEMAPDAKVRFFFSTRAPKPWIASCYGQNLRATRLTLTASEYARKFRRSADLNRIVDMVETAVSPCPVDRCALEDSQARPFGPLDPVLDLTALPAVVRQKLVPLAPANSALPQVVLDQILTLNQSDLDDADLRDAKKALYRRQG